MVFLNGKFVTTSEAMVSAFDAGMQHGVGLFETMLGVCGASKTPGEQSCRVIHLHEHMTRLAHAAKTLGLSDSLRRDALADAVERTLTKTSQHMPDVERFRIRLTITGGDLNLLSKARENTTAAPSASANSQMPTILIHAQPATIYPQEMYEHGVLVSIADLKANPLDPFAGHKALNYWPRLRELQLAAASGAAESLVFQVTNHLAGGCVSNAFLVKNGTVFTPWACGEREALEQAEREDRELSAHDANDVDDTDSSTPPSTPANSSGGPSTASKSPYLASPVLAGITRRWVLDWCDNENIDVERRMLTIDDVLKADEIFLTNSSWGVLPVTRVEAATIARGRVGEVTSQLVEAWNAEIA